MYLCSSLPKTRQLLLILSTEKCPCGKAPPSPSFIVSQEIYPGWFSRLYLHHLFQTPNALLSALFFPISEEKVSSFLTGKCTIYVFISFTSTGTLIHSLAFSPLSSHTLLQLLLLLPSKYWMSSVLPSKHKSEQIPGGKESKPPVYPVPCTTSLTSSSGGSLCLPTMTALNIRILCQAPTRPPIHYHFSYQLHVRHLHFLRFLPQCVFQQHWNSPPQGHQ